MIGSTDVHGVGHVLARRRGTILSVVAAFAALGFAINALTPPIYRAIVRIEIRAPRDRSPLTGEALGSSSFQSENVSMYTAADLITNRRLLGQLVGEFGGRGWILTAAEDNVARHAFDRLLGRRDIPAAGAPEPGGDARPGGPADPELLGARIDWLETTISVEPVRDTRLVDIRVEHARPEAARAIADRLAELFVAYQSRRSADADTAGFGYLRGQVDQLKRKIDGAQAQLYGSDHANPISVESRIRQLNGAITDLNDAYTRAKADRVAIGARLARLENFVPDSLADWSLLPVGNPALDALRRDLLSAQMQFSAARGVYKERHPRLVELESRCATLKASVRGELQRGIGSLRAEQSALEAREEDLSSSLRRNEDEMSDAQERSRRYAVIEGDMKVNRDLYNALLGKVEEGRIAGEVKNPPVEIVDPATVDPRPVRPRKLVNLAICLLAGTLAGAGLSLLRDSVRHTIRVPEEVVEKLDLPVLGVIPKRERAAGG